MQSQPRLFGQSIHCDKWSLAFVMPRVFLRQVAAVHLIRCLVVKRLGELAALSDVAEVRAAVAGDGLFYRIQAPRPGRSRR